MKRIAAFLLVSSLGVGCATTDAKKTPGAMPFNTASKAKTVPGVVGPKGTPVKEAAKSKPTGDVVQASATTVTDPAVTQASGFSRIVGGGHKDSCDTCNTGPVSRGDRGCATGDCGTGYSGGYGRGIVPAPPMGPAGAVAGVGMIGPGMGFPMTSNMRTSIRFIGPNGSRVMWYANGSYSEPGLSMPADYNFAQANIYRLKVVGLKPGNTYYPTLEVYAATLKSLTYLDHGTVPVSFTAEDLARVDAGNLVVKVIYLPDALYQDVTAIGGAEEIVSTQLEPGADPIVEANRRGTILAIIRLGNINLENQNSPAKDAPVNSYGGPVMAAPASSGPTASMSTPPLAMPTAMAPAPMPSIPATPTSLKK